jgi:transposase
VTIQFSFDKKIMVRTSSNQKKIIFAQNIHNPMTFNQARIIELECQLSTQSQLIEELSAQLAKLEEQNAKLSEQNAELSEQNAKLEKELSLYRNRKNSSNSSIPPSQDPYRVKRTESLRQRSGRKPGGQPGHQGFFLEEVSDPTNTVIHQPNYCNCCGKDLSEIASEFIGKRQVIDIPPITPTVTEHRIYGKRCSCGHFTESHYPAEAHRSVGYGSRIEALTAYFHGRQYLPFDRLEELYSDVFGLSISSGCLVNMVGTFAEKASGIYETIRRRVANAPVIGADETGTCIKGKNGWTWVFQTPEATYIHSDTSRAKAVIDQLFPEGFPKATLVHDCWKSYFGVPTKNHQICTAHLLRELKYLDKLYQGQHWTADFTSLLHKALDLKKTLTAADYLQPVEDRTKLEEQLDMLLGQSIDSAHDKLIVFKNRIIKYRPYLFTFLYCHHVPPDNNASERAVRTFKVKQKVSGLFRSNQGAKSFAVIRSVIDTTIKNTKNVVEALNAVAILSG